MNNQARRVVILGIILLLLVAGIWYAAKRGTKVSLTPVAEAPVATGTTAGTPQIKIALLDYTATKPGITRGCDHVVLVNRTVATTTTPLDTALKTLFALNAQTVDSLDNFLPKTKATLAYDHVTLSGGIAKVYLNGSLSGLAGVCDDPRAKIQIEETALQFETVKKVELYLNGNETELQPNEQG